ncbi:MAG: hypothetical protein WAT79_02090 [Saprospiraceae bacterium]
MTVENIRTCFENYFLAYKSDRREDLIYHYFTIIDIIKNFMICGNLPAIFAMNDEFLSNIKHWPDARISVNQNTIHNLLIEHQKNLKNQLIVANKICKSYYYFNFDVFSIFERNNEQRNELIEYYNNTLIRLHDRDMSIWIKMIQTNFENGSLLVNLNLLRQIMLETLSPPSDISIISDYIDSLQNSTLLKPVNKKDAIDDKNKTNKSITTPAICFLLFAYYKSKEYKYDDFEGIKSIEVKNIIKVVNKRYKGDDKWMLLLNTSLQNLKYRSVKNETIHDYFRYKKLFGIIVPKQPDDIIAIDCKKVNQHISVLKRDLESLITPDILNQFRLLRTKPKEYFKSSKDIYSSKTITIK